MEKGETVMMHTLLWYNHDRRCSFIFRRRELPARLREDKNCEWLQQRVRLRSTGSSEITHLKPVTKKRLNETAEVVWDIKHHHTIRDTNRCFISGSSKLLLTF
ncbi:hypothetical protein F2P81_000100 [Scophthalmus maximus]|uniref:Uncharacterized protein n=1 Tax=Scophthalmus maximus TaxID=52904 RepID=A0A6A4TIC4_SCOMX|nr:hypothetical protein F2P81_000100 [Scophthalmus maximus]